MNRIGLKKAIVFVAVIVVFGGLVLAADGGRGRRGGFGPGFGRGRAQDPNEAVPDRPMRNRGMRLGRGLRAERPVDVNSTATDNANIPVNRGRGYGWGRNRNQQQNPGRGREQQAGQGPGARLGRGQGFGRGRAIQSGPDGNQRPQNGSGPGARLGRGQGFGRGRDIQQGLRWNRSQRNGQGQRARLGRGLGFGRGQENRQGPMGGQRLFNSRRGRGRNNAEIGRPSLMRERGGNARWYSYEYLRDVPDRIWGQRRGRRQNLRTPDDKTTEQEQTARPRRPMRGQGRFWEE